MNHDEAIEPNSQRRLASHTSLICYTQVTHIHTYYYTYTSPIYVLLNIYQNKPNNLIIFLFYRYLFIQTSRQCTETFEKNRGIKSSVIITFCSIEHAFHGHSPVGAAMTRPALSQCLAYRSTIQSNTECLIMEIHLKAILNYTKARDYI